MLSEDNWQLELINSAVNNPERFTDIQFLP